MPKFKSILGAVILVGTLAVVTGWGNEAKKDPRALEAVQGDFFNKPNAQPESDTTTSPRSGTVRYRDREATATNTEQLQQWRQSCASSQGDMKAYRECYNQEKKKSATANQAAVPLIEKNTETERNIGSLPQGDLNYPEPEIGSTPDLIPLEE